MRWEFVEFTRIVRGRYVAMCEVWKTLYNGFRCQNGRKGEILELLKLRSAKESCVSF